jgi:uncharacterized protein (DUF1800 family)
MDKNILWSLRLGFSARQAPLLQEYGIEAFLKKSFDYSINPAEPEIIKTMPRTDKELAVLRRQISSEPDGRKKWNTIEATNWLELGSWWLKAMYESNYALREKMAFFWHNHYVVNAKSVYVPYYTYRHNVLLRENAFGNFRELTKKVVRSNAMIKYLNNDKNSKDKYNENLSRELLELFTLGIGNYTENDIKGGARGLAGLSYGKDEGQYYPEKENDAPFEYLGKRGNFKCDEMIDIIFEQKNAPYRITEKLLRWFIYDNPPEKLVTYYGDYLRKNDYEIQPLLIKMFTEEFDKPTAGSKIKDPSVFILQALYELDFKNIDYKIVYHFLRAQNMAPYNQPNVKGWDGGRAWLTAQLFVQRNNAADQICKGRLLNQPIDNVNQNAGVIIRQDWKKGKGDDIIKTLRDRLLFTTDDDLAANMKNIIPHDFNPMAPGANNSILRLYGYILKTPEFQLI